VLWLVGAAHKLTSFRLFCATIRDYRIVPNVALLPAATMIIALEMALGVALLAPIVRSTGLVISAALLTLYAAAIGVNLVRGRRHIDCGCIAGGLGQPLSEWLVARNLALAGVALAGLLPVESRTLIWVDGISIGATVGILAALYAAFDRLVANSHGLAGLGD
jgi:phosphotransferase system  glucose/maltose/N-acetylglucosamine-specific IIC component